jgi:phosphoglycolate phosphatase
MKAYLFDLDGTLADSRAGLYPAFRAGLQVIGIASVSDEQLAVFLGTRLPEIFHAFRPEIAQREIDAGMAAFRAAYEITGIIDSELYPGVMQMLASIRQRGSAIWVVTSKPEPQAVRVAAHLKLDAYVAGVVGASLAETDTKTVLVARALQAAQVAGHEAVMVGDRHYDIIGAIANRLLPVGALLGLRLPGRTRRRRMPPFRPLGGPVSRAVCGDGAGVFGARAVGQSCGAMN